MDGEKPEECYSPLTSAGMTKTAGEAFGAVTGVGDISQIRQPPVVVGGQPIFGDGDRIRHPAPHVTVYTRVASHPGRLRAPAHTNDYHRAFCTHVVKRERMYVLEV